MSSALIVIDVQNGFITDSSRSIIPNVLNLAHQASRLGVPVLYTRFFNHPNSQYIRLLRWEKLTGPPETDLHPEVVQIAKLVFDKLGYTSLTPQLKSWLRERRINRLYCCGIATENCVLKTAVDAFEEDIEPIVVTDACASHAGKAMHDMGLQILARFIGKGQLRSLEDVVYGGLS